MKSYKAYSIRNFQDIPQVQRSLTKEELFDIEVVGSVLPFKVNNYVVDNLIDWNNHQNDPIYTLTFPKKEMLRPSHYEEMANAIKGGAQKSELKLIANKIRLELNPHPSGQLTSNVPAVEDVKLTGVQHKYRETMLFFPSQGQTCHAYCTFCFRWPQFVGMNELKFAMRDSELIIKYLRTQPETSDIVFTGGDPMIMKTKLIKHYIEAILDAKLPGLKNIRIGTKALSYWPQRFLNDEDADELLFLFEKVKKAGIHLAFMAHFNHPNELETEECVDAIHRIQNTGAVIRTQAPVLRHINDDAETWARMWRDQVKLGCIPYYYLIPRDTGAQHYFAVKLDRAWEIFKDAYKNVSGIARTVRGPSMSIWHGKIQIVGISEIRGEKVFVLQFIQGRNADWVSRPFFAKYDPNARWMDVLQPAFGEEKFFFEEEFAMPRPALYGKQTLENMILTQ